MQIDINLAPDTNGKLWYYDTDRMEQVLTNLGQCLPILHREMQLLSVQANQINTIFLYVSDTGSGIAPEHIDLVFDRFYKVDASRKRGKGTGLGLFICRMIIEAQDGTIDLKSHLGEGTTFIIKLPKPPKR